jgi:hypothetical protein
VDVITPGYGLDNFEGTGWVHVYAHVGPLERVEPGKLVEVGDRLGHPACEGAAIPLTRTAFTRRFNGEWLAVDDPQRPLVLGGWTALPAPTAGAGWLVASGQPSREASLVKQAATNGVLPVPGGP